LGTGYFADLNGDGATDAVMVGSPAGASAATDAEMIAFVNDGSGRMTEASGALLGGGALPLDGASTAVVLDANGDGRADLYVPSLGFDLYPWAGAQDRLLIQQPGGGLRDETDARLPIKDGAHFAAAAADLTWDGH